MKIIIILTFSGLLLFFLISIESNRNVLVNGKPIICSREAYNCPSYDGPLQNKRLKNCDDVKLVWEKCKKDVHGLDEDMDGIPCEKDYCFMKK